MFGMGIVYLKMKVITLKIDQKISLQVIELLEMFNPNNNQEDKPPRMHQDTRDDYYDYDKNEKIIYI